MPSQDDKTQFIVLGRKEHHDEVPSVAAPLDTSNVITPSMEDVTRIMTTNPRSSDTQSPTPEAFDIDDFFGTSHDDVTASTEDFQASSDHQVGAINFANQAPQSNLPPIGSEEPDMVFNTIVHAIGGNQYQSRALAPGEVIDRYQVIEPIAEGGTSRVYKIEHKYLGQSFALKTLKTENSQSSADLFLEEAKILSKLHDPSVVRIYDAGVTDLIPYMVLEYVHGDSVRERIKQRKFASFEQIVDMLEDLCPALVQQQKHDIVHGDIKPDNIICRQGEGKHCLIDYGHFGRIGADPQHAEIVFMGTPKYMAPELNNGRISIAADFYSLGLTLCEYAGGVRQDTKSQSDYVDAFSTFEFSSPVPANLAAILKSMTAFDESQRYKLAADLAEDVNQLRDYNGIVLGAMQGNVFVAIEFSKQFESVFDSISICCHSNLLRSRRMDRLVFSRDIWRNIEIEIENAKIVIADVTEGAATRSPNPNVLTEAAHARALNKDLILISQSSPEDLPFDWRHMPVLQYENSTDGLKKLVSELTHKIQSLRRNNSTEL